MSTRNSHHLALKKKKIPSLLSTSLLFDSGWMWWDVPLTLATWEAEVGGLTPAWELDETASLD